MLHVLSKIQVDRETDICMHVIAASLSSQQPEYLNRRAHQGQKPRWVARERVRKLKTQPKPAFDEVYGEPYG